MYQEAICVLVHNYKVKLGGAENPWVSVTLSKNEPRIVKSTVADFSVGLEMGKIEVTMKYSTDSLPGGSPLLSMVISIEGSATEYQKTLNHARGNTHIQCHVTSQHSAQSAEIFFRTCREKVEMGETIPVIIKDHKGVLICTLRFSEVSRFSWEEKLKEVEELRKERNNLN